MTNKRLWIIAVLCFGALIAFKTINDHIGREVSAITETPRHGSAAGIAPAAPPAVGQESSVRRRKPGEKIVRKDRLSPGRNYQESVFYLNDMEVARQKIVNEKVVESSGEIPEGRIDFLDEFKKTYGAEYYLQGKKSGPSRTYFADGRSNIEAYYQWGKLLWKREYYNDGGIRLEVNYEDAREQTGNKERGAGRVYYRDGTIKYEWNLTNSEKIGFKKSYNQDGGLRAAFYFDEYGQPVE
jgi:antitoxin component YwqK of YwqJK toxin-antitoxin module